MELLILEFLDYIEQMTNVKEQFFIIVPIGLEGLAKEELLEKTSLIFPDNTCEVLETTKGGILISAPMYEGCLLNKYLKIPTRILLRCDKFKARDLPKLFNKLKTIKWNDFFPSPNIDFKISSKKSRLFDSRKIEKSAQDAIDFFFKGQAIKKEYQSSDNKYGCLYLHFIDDECSLSIDTSGERLDRRGIKSKTTAAPIRETLASAALLATSKYFDQSFSVYDPMCGSGTILIEALNFYKQQQRRKYHFEVIPLFKKEKAKKKIVIQKALCQKVYGSDISKEAIDICQSNVIDDSAEIFHQDILSPENKFKVDAIVCNPPYDMRVKTKTPIASFYQEVIKELILNFSPKVITIIIPKDSLPKNKGYKVINRVEFENGGISVEMLTLGNFSL